MGLELVQAEVRRGWKPPGVESRSRRSPLTSNAVDGPPIAETPCESRAEGPEADLRKTPEPQ